MVTLSTGWRSLRHMLLAVAIGLLAPAAGAASDSEPAAWAALRDGAIVLYRHADAPGGGDPPGFRLDDCATQRNLGDAGREQARQIGAAFRQNQVKPGSVLASQWCRTRETAQLAFPGRVVLNAAFNSFFQDRTRSGPQTEAARAILRDWSGPGALVVVTHQVNITALTGLVPASGEGIVLRRAGDELQLVGRIRP